MLALTIYFCPSGHQICTANIAKYFVKIIFKAKDKKKSLLTFIINRSKGVFTNILAAPLAYKRC